MIEFSKKQWAQLKAQADKVFRAKSRQRRIDARKPMVEKIKDLKIIQNMAIVKPSTIK